jgi:hypothetical protein
MEQPKSTSDGQPGAGPATTAPPTWMHRAASYVPDRRAKMLEHMARARSVPQPKVAQAQAAKVTGLPRMSGWDILRDAYGCAVLSAIAALVFQSRVPFYLGAFMFLTNGERIESVLAMIGIRFEPGAIGPDIVKNFGSLLGWFVLLVSLQDAVPTWLMERLPLAEPPWSVVAGFAFALVILETLATRAARRVLPPFGLKPDPNSPAWAAIKFVGIIGVLVVLRYL